MTETRIIELEMICAAHPGHRSSALILECLAAIRELQAKLEKKQATALKRGQFVPPTVEEVAEYFKDGGVFNGSSDATAVEFIDFYTARAWRLPGNVKMQDWQAACRNWENREKKRRAPVVGKVSAVPRL